MRKLFLPLAVSCLLVATLGTYRASSREEASELGKEYCYSTWSSGGNEDFVKCNGCIMITGNNPTDKGECRP